MEDGGIEEEVAADEAVSAFEREVGLTKVPVTRLQVGN